MIVSNNAMPSPTWPDFEDVAFNVEKNLIRLNINVKYGIL